MLGRAGGRSRLRRRTGLPITWLESANRRLAAFEIGAITLLISILFLANAYAVLSRDLLGRYPAWIIEVSELLMVWLVFLGGAWLYRARRQIAMVALVEALPAAPRRLLEITGELVVLGFACLVLWQGLRYQPVLYASLTPVLRLPKNLTSAMIPLAYLSIALASTERLLRLARRPG
jgi:TRAP-type transport system small permease protein